MMSLSALPFPGKYDYFFQYLEYFYQKKGGITSQTEIWQILFHPHDSWWTSCEKKICSNIFQFCGYRSQRTFQKNFNPDFQIWLLFLVPFLHVFKIYVTWPEAEFKSESIGTSFKSQKWKTKKLVCPFLIVLFYFETNLIE